MANDQIALVVEAIARAKEITPKGNDVRVYILGGTGLNTIYGQVLKDILLKLQYDEGIIKIKSFPEWWASNPLAKEILISIQNVRQNSSTVYFTVETLNGFDEWCLDYITKIESLTTKEVSPIQIEKAIPGTEIIYQITYTAAREVILNDIIQLAKPDFNSENELVFNYLYANPNQIFTKEQVKNSIGGELSKSLHKIVENLGFKGEFKKVFFSVSENSIIFRNPITKDDLERIGINRIRLPK